jgi:hypothetical protein
MFPTVHLGFNCLPALPVDQWLGVFVFLVKKKKTPPLHIINQQIMQTAEFWVLQKKKLADWLWNKLQAAPQKFLIYC